MEQCKNYFLKLNIFQASSGSHQQVDENPYEQRTQVVATRVYLLLLVLILINFLVITCLNSETVTITVQNPSLAQIQSLPNNRICPCSKVSFSYDKFVSSNVSFHQVCSSDFVSDRWISSLFYGENASHFLQTDFRSVGFAEFQALASFCQLSQANVNQTLLFFGSSLFISTQFDISPTDLRTKVIATFNRFRSSISTMFKSQIQLISTIIINNHFLNALGTSIIPNKNRATILIAKKQVGYYVPSYMHTAAKNNCVCTQAEIFEDESCRGPSGIYEEYFDIDIADVDDWYVPTVFIPDFTSSCMPVDACLLSSLECFFNQSCVNSIFPYQRMTDGVMWNFTALNSDNKSKPSRFKTNSRIKSIVDELMVEEWHVQELYDKYFQECAPIVCTYLTNIYPDFLSVLNTFISLLGGLCAGLGLIVLPVVRFIRKRLWPPPTNSEPPQSPPISFMVRLCRKTRSALKRILTELNVFKINSNDNNDQSQIRYQIIATRLYICLLALILVILTVYLALTPQTYVKTINDPTPAQFSNLHSRYPLSLRCACSSISIPYDVFLTIEARYHQICSSVLVSSTWLWHLENALLLMLHFPYRHEFGRHAGSQFHLLKGLCTEAKETITNSLEQFLNQTLITTQVIPKETFELQANAFIVEWKKLTSNTFNRTLQLIRATQYGNHLVASDLNSFFDVNVMSNTFTLNSSIYYDECNCMLSSSCHSPMRLYSTWDRTPRYKFDISSFFVGCFRLDALLKSTLECFYNQTCMDNVNTAIQPPSLAFNFTALNATDNLPNETIDSVASNLFVHKWSESISFDNYFTFCAPQSCTYEYTSRRNVILLITAVIGIFGSLPALLKNIFVIFLWLMTKMRRCNISLRATKTWLHTHVTDKQHLTNGLSMVLIVATLTALAFASKFTLQTTRNEISNPSLEAYEELLTRHSDTLQCPCVLSSIPYKLFMNVSVMNRHQVCSSVFITEKWINVLLLPEPQSNHSALDFRKTATSFFQLLASLCQLSEQYLTDELSDFMSRSLVNTNVISRLQLNEQMQSLLKQFQLNTPTSFLTTLQLIRAMTSDNLLIPVFETNWQWMDPSLKHLNYWGIKLNTKPIVYNGSCNCGLSSQCFQESSTMPGLMVGCYPLESLLKSTLQCLYNASCFSLLPTVNESFTPLHESKTSRYEKNSTVEFILNQLMVEQWFNSVKYENYYNQCAPSLCSYSYTQRRPTLEVLTSVLGIQGGLMIIMNIVARILVAVWQKILIERGHNVQVQPM